MKAREFYGKPIRKGVTDARFPEKLTLENFRNQIVEHFDSYARNMKQNGADEPKYIEDWVQQYMAWLEIEQE